MANSIRIKLENPKPIDLDFNDKISINYLKPDHAALNNLEYENSGHTGFMPARLSILPETPAESKNERMCLSIYDKETDTTSHIGFNDLVGRIIKTVSEVPANAQKGQYLFLQVKEED